MRQGLAAAVPVRYEMVPMKDESKGTRQKVGDRMERSDGRGIHMGRHQLFFVFALHYE